MIKSKFTLWPLLPLVIVLLLSSVFVSAVVNQQSIFNPNLSPFADFILLVFFGAVFWWIFFGELFRKCVRARLSNNTVEIRAFLGLGFRRINEWSYYDGFIINEVPSRAGTYEYLYVIKDNTRTLLVSDFYHKNYKEIKHFLVNNRIGKLSKEPWSFTQEMKEVFLF